MRFLIFAAALAALAPSAFAQQALIDGAALIGPPPEASSPDAAADRLDMARTVSPERLAQARADQAYSPWSALAPVLGADFTAARLPRTARVFTDLEAALDPPVNAAKRHFSRERPYVSQPSLLRCDAPGASGGSSPSYPSGHAAAGWAWGLIAAELVPSRADALLQRGRDFGDSRVICGFHYPSDIAASRAIAAGVIARLHADPNFRRDMDAARRELARAYRD